MAALSLLLALATSGAPHPALAPWDAISPSLEALYVDLHQHPELSLQEKETAAKLASRLQALGYQVTTGIGGHGLVGVLRNGSGPTVLLRTDLDALPIREETGLPFASAGTAQNSSGESVSVMHACGHDVHMTGWIGAATLLARSKARWRGTLVLVGQPAEELGSGARAMIADGLFTRFPRPDFAVAVHQTPMLPAGQVGVVPGFALAFVDTVEIVVHGRGGHGASPHLTVDPVLLAARMVVALQGIVAREVNPVDPAVITVGSIHGGTRSNIIPDEVKLRLTVRAYKQEVQRQLLAAIGRVARGEAAVSGAPREPEVTVLGTSTPSVFNDPKLSQRLRAALTRTLGEAAVTDFPPIMGSEDFAEFGSAGIPSNLFWVGSAAPAVFAEARSRGTYPPGNHTAAMTPDRAPTIRAAASTLTLAALELLTPPEAAAPTPAARPAEAARAEANRKALAALLADHWEYFLARSPERASALGDLRYNDQSSDLSAGAVAANLDRTRAYLVRFQELDPAGLTEQEGLTRTLMIRAFEEELEGARFENWKMPVNQMGGLHLRAAQFPNLLRFQTVKDFEDWTTRLRHLPKQFDDTIANMRLGLAAGLMPPGFLLEKVAAQAAGIAAMKPEQTPFARCLEKLPTSLPAAEQARLRQALLATVTEQVLPAYVRFARFVKEEYAPRGRTEVGTWALPDGVARYAFQVRASTTTRLTPDQIHELGLREVARIEGEMLAVARQAGHADLAAFRAAIASDPKLRPTSRQQILEIYRGHLDAMGKELPRLFGRLPKAGFIVAPVEEFREKGAAGAQYQGPAPDGSRPGRIEVNTGDFADRKTITFESTAYHEAVPGHHLQIAIQLELEALPAQRRFWLHFVAFAEGWALYAERLGREVGRFQEPASSYGNLEDEMLRAIRLVVDTGLHARKWSRQQVVQFFHDHSAMDEVDLQAETDRYIVWPGQALGYKVGQLQILALRERATRDLQAAFDLRAFHDMVLGGGSLPLDVLETRGAAWIVAEQARRSSR